MCIGLYVILVFVFNRLNALFVFVKVYPSNNLLGNVQLFMLPFYVYLQCFYQFNVNWELL